MSYKIILADGQEIKDLGLNGNNYISNRSHEAKLTEANLKTVTITDPEGGESVIEDAYLIHATKYGQEHWFAIAEKTAAMKQQELLGRLQAENADLEGAVMELSMIISMMMLGGND